jgi:hypothetical protein
MNDFLYSDLEKFPFSFRDLSDIYTVEHTETRLVETQEN